MREYSVFIYKHKNKYYAHAIDPHHIRIIPSEYNSKGFANIIHILRTNRLFPDAIGLVIFDVPKKTLGEKLNIFEEKIVRDNLEAVVRNESIRLGIQMMSD